MDFCDRMFDQDLNRRVVESLIKAGAFDRMGYRRSQLMQVYGQVLDGIAASRKRNVEGQLDLFCFGGGEERAPAPLPALHLPDLPEYQPPGADDHGEGDHRPLPLRPPHGPVPGGRPAAGR